MSEPVSGSGRLDLRAVDRFIEHREELRRPYDSTLDVVTALLVHCRALRAALQRIAEYDAAAEAGFLDEWVEANAFHRCRAIAAEVLVAAGDAAGAAPEETQHG